MLLRSRTSWVAAATVLLAATAVSSAAFAHDRHRRHRDRSHHVDRHHRHGHVRHVRPLPYPHRVDFVVPRYIRPRVVDVYRPYFRGRVFHADHRHFHAVYDFPVYTTRGTVYRTHAYCGERLFVGGHVSYHGRGFGIHLDF